MFTLALFSISTLSFHTFRLQEDEFELFCLDGTRRSIREYRDCNWGQVPSDAIVTTSAKNTETRLKYQKFLSKLVELFGTRTAEQRNNFRNSTEYRGLQDFPSRDVNVVDSSPSFNQRPPFQLFQSFPRYGMVSNLLIQDDSITLKVCHRDTTFFIFSY